MKAAFVQDSLKKNISEVYDTAERISGAHMRKINKTACSVTVILNERNKSYAAE
jgi:hypothetical protein